MQRFQWLVGVLGLTTVACSLEVAILYHHNALNGTRRVNLRVTPNSCSLRLC